MPKFDSNDIALRALGEDVGHDASLAIDGDESARMEQESLNKVVETARRNSPIHFEHPPASVWESIAAATSKPPSNEDDNRPSQAIAPFKKNNRRRFFTKLTTIAAAACIALVGTFFATSLTKDDVTEIESIALAAGEGVSTEGTATLIRHNDRFQLRIELSQFTKAPDHYRELWLLKSDGSGLISLGPIQGNGTYDIPVEIDVQDYPVVDISDEPIDGDPTHSGKTLYRGELQSV